MLLKREAGDFWGAKRRDVETQGFRFEALDATAPEKEVVRHSHEWPHFIFVFDGAYISSARGAPALSATPLLIYNPAGTIHRDRFLHGRGAFLAVTLGEEAVRLASGLAVLENEARIVNELSGIRFARSVAELMFSDSREDFAEDLSLSFLEAVTGGQTLDVTSPPSWLRTAIEMIREEAGSIRVKDVASYVGVHPVHLARVFRLYAACSPGEMLRARQIERAAAMLAISESSPAEISAATGFADQSHLSNRFRHSFQLSPQQWRANHVAFLQDE